MMFEIRRAEAGERVLGLRGIYKNGIYKVSHPFDDYVHVTGYGRLFGIPHGAYVVLNENVQVEQRKAEVGDYIISHGSRKGGTVTEINEHESYLVIKESSGDRWRVYHSGYSVLTEEKTLEDTAAELATKPEAIDNYEKKEEQKIDMVNNPPHYTYGTMETIDIMEATSTKEELIGHLRNTALKYLLRFQRKNGVQDLDKCIWYVERLKQTLKENS